MCGAVVAIIHKKELFKEKCLCFPSSVTYIIKRFRELKCKKQRWACVGHLWPLTLQLPLNQTLLMSSWHVYIRSYFWPAVQSFLHKRLLLFDWTKTDHMLNLFRGNFFFFQLESFKIDHHTTEAHFCCFHVVLQMFCGWNNDCRLWTEKRPFSLSTSLKVKVFDSKGL